MLDKLSHCLNISLLFLNGMSQSIEITKETAGVPKIGIAILLSIMAFSMFVVGYDQGTPVLSSTGRKGVRRPLLARTISRY